MVYKTYKNGDDWGMLDENSKAAHICCAAVHAQASDTILATKANEGILWNHGALEFGTSKSIQILILQDLRILKVNF